MRPMGKISLNILGAALCLSVATSCESIFDGEGNCNYENYVTFTYKYNHSWGEGFGSQVSSVTLYVFNPSTGKLVTTVSDQGEDLDDDNYELKLDLEPGTYDVIAWCGLRDNQGRFAIDSPVSNINDLTCRLITKTREDDILYQDEYLNPLFYGRTMLTISTRPGKHVTTIELIKDTNNFNLSLQHSSDVMFNDDMFTVTFTDDNSVIGYDNTLVGSSSVTYYPWSVSTGSINAGYGTLNFLQTEISTSRLMANHNPRIVITDNATGQTVYSIPIIQWALQFRGEQYLGMDDQEYLDRENDYDIMLYLNSDAGGWQASSIVINGFNVE